jgi:hypothetical protein
MHVFKVESPYYPDGHESTHWLLVSRNLPVLQEAHNVPSKQLLQVEAQV